MLTNILIAILALFGAGCAAQAQESGNAQPPQRQEADGRLDANSSVDRILDALDKRGEELRAFVADVKLTETDVTTGTDVARTGKIWIELGPEGSSARSRVMFDKRTANNRITDEKIEYLLDGQNLIDRTYRTKTQVTRQVLRPGEKINLLKLGEGPFPLPIGQDEAEVHRLFEVKKIESQPDDPPNTVHLQLTPKEGTQFERKFMSIDAWVDLEDHMPKRIETVDPNGVTVRTTELTNLKINPDLKDADFALEKIDEGEWNLIYEKFED
jgi:outer membrane lipoprotein-sorting protein